MAAYRRVDGFKSPAGWLPVHRDQLRALYLLHVHCSIDYECFWVGQTTCMRTDVFICQTYCRRWMCVWLHGDIWRSRMDNESNVMTNMMILMTEKMFCLLHRHSHALFQWHFFPGETVLASWFYSSSCSCTQYKNGFSNSSFHSVVFVVRSTHLSWPNKVGLKCPSVCTYVCMSIHPQKVSSISMKFGM